MAIHVMRCPERRISAVSQADAPMQAKHGAQARPGDDYFFSSIAFRLPRAELVDAGNRLDGGLVVLVGRGIVVHELAIERTAPLDDRAAAVAGFTEMVEL